MGEVRLFAGDFAPKWWAFCQGQLLEISQNSALFFILGTTYGGNGVTNFALPDLRGRAPIGTGEAPGSRNYGLGEESGEPTHTLTVAELPGHSHTAQAQINARAGGGAAGSPAGNYPAASTARDNPYAASAGATLNAGAAQVTVALAGGNQPHNNMPPYLGLHYIICLSGVFPSRP